MRQHLAAVLWTSTLSACSLIYNPSNIDKNETPPDAPIADANPALLRIDEVKSPVLLEGAGQDGSAPQVLVVYGGHISQNATVTLAPKTPDANLMSVELANVSIAADGNSFAGTVKVGYMDDADETGPMAVSRIPLVVTITQEGAPAPVSFEDEGSFYVKPLDELTAVGGQVGPNAGKLYSKVEVNGPMDFPPGGQRVVIRAVGLVDIKGAVNASASGVMGGAGGCNGGGVSQRGECYGGGGAGVGASKAGSGGGFAERGGGDTGGMISGDPMLSAYDDGGAKTNRGAGGGGGTPTLALLGGGPGGGGGGAIDIAAGGNLSVQSVVANGAPGTNGNGGGGGGGGAGGALVLRAGGTLTFPASVSLEGGAGGSGGGTGGVGSVGRWRYDANAITGSPSQTPAPRRGPMLNVPENPIFEVKNPTLTVVGDAGEVNIIVRHGDGDIDERSVTLTSEATAVTPPNLSIGYNLVCVVVVGGDIEADDAKNCIEVAFIP